MQIRALLNESIAKLKEQGSSSPRLDAELLMMHVTKFNKVQLITGDLADLNALDETVFRALLAERLKGVPMAYILGERDFWDLTLKVTPDTLIPRPDTEILVEKALTLINCNHLRDVLDLGTGTGAIILALKHSAPEIRATAIDMSAAALEVAQENAARYHLEVNFQQGCWFTPFVEESAEAQAELQAELQSGGRAGAHAAAHDALALSDGQSRAAQLKAQAQAQAGLLPQAARFDLIVSNPPYIEEDDPHLSQGDVRFEPRSALVSGKDGLDDIRIIVHEARAFLRNNGYLLLEHGYNQGAAVRALLSELGYAKVETIRDYGQNERVTLGCYRPQ